MSQGWRLVCAAAAIMASACTPSDAEVFERLRSQVLMPACAGKKVMGYNERNVGQDYSDTIRVKVEATCGRKWRTALAANGSYDCNGSSCTRYDEARRFDEEWATIKFVSPAVIEVELTKI